MILYCTKVASSVSKEESASVIRGSGFSLKQLVYLVRLNLCELITMWCLLFISGKGKKMLNCFMEPSNRNIIGLSWYATLLKKYIYELSVVGAPQSATKALAAKSCGSRWWKICWWQLLGQRLTRKTLGLSAKKWLLIVSFQLCPLYTKMPCSSTRFFSPAK